MNKSISYTKIANSPLMWISAAIAVSVVVFQAVLFFKKSKLAAKETGITHEQVRLAIKSTIISSIGPSVVILVTMISLIVSLGAPFSWLRLSYIGSVNYVAMAAGFGAQAMGTTLEHLNSTAFACGIWVVTCGSLGWILFTLLFADKMNKVNHLLSRGNAKMVPLISAGAMLGAFANLASGNFFSSRGSFSFGSAPAIATICGCILMMILSRQARIKNIKWLREWAFAISIFSGMFVGFACHAVL